MSLGRPLHPSWRSTAGTGQGKVQSEPHFPGLAHLSPSGEVRIWNVCSECIHHHMLPGSGSVLVCIQEDSLLSRFLMAHLFAQVAVHDSHLLVCQKA